MGETTLQQIRVVDSHTTGEPTRVVVTGGPDLGRGSLAERRQRFVDEFGAFRSAIVNEPRGSDVMVGAILPRITGSAYVCAEATLVLDPNDPFQMGIRA